MCHIAIDVDLFHARQPFGEPITQRLTQRMGLPMPRLWVIPEASPNAFATGHNPNHASVAVSTGLLHDVVEDTLVDLATIKSYFGDEIVLLVDGLTKIANISDLSKEKQQAENVRKMVLAMITDVRVVLIKLADRLHNMRTMQFLKPEKRERISQETLDIYAPIAHRLGMGKMRSELEDLAFKNLYPDEYKRLAKKVDARRPELEAALEKIKAAIAENLKENEVPFVEIQGRVKRLYSLWKKLKKFNAGPKQ